MPETRELIEIGGTSSGLDVRNVLMPKRVWRAYNLSGRVYAVDAPWTALSLECETLLRPIHGGTETIDTVVTGSGLLEDLGALVPRQRATRFSALEGLQPTDAALAVTLWAGSPYGEDRVRQLTGNEDARGGSTLPAHAETAASLREMLGISTEALALICGVTRETYSRWVSGSQIRGTNLTRLQYLHALASEAVRRLGDRFRAWLTTPIDVATGSRATPLELLERGYFDRLHQLIVDLPDAQPHDEDRYLALDKLTEEQEESWD